MVIHDLVMARARVTRSARVRVRRRLMLRFRARASQGTQSGILVAVFGQSNQKYIFRPMAWPVI